MRALPFFFLILVTGILWALILTPNRGAANELEPTQPSTIDKLQKYADPEKGPKRDRPGDAVLFWQTRLQTPNGENPARLNYQAKLQLDARRSLLGGPVPPNFRFEDFGPGNFGGRVRAVILDPNDTSTIVTGGVSGGVWKTDNGGDSWRGTSDFLNNLAISSMIADPDDSDVLWAGTGEGFFNVDAVRGLGIFKSEDFGDTWTQLPSTDNSNFNYVNRMARLPGTNVLLAATRSGLFRSADLGGSWTDVGPLSPTSRGYVDLKVDPTNSNRILAYHFGAYDLPRVTLTINSPGPIVGDYLAVHAQFGPRLTDVGVLTGDIVLVEDDTPPASDGCNTLVNGGALSGNIALIDRGNCSFVIKVKSAQDAGAIGAIVVNNVASPPTSMGGTDPTITIPSVMISMADGALLKANLATLNGTLTPGAIDSFMSRSTNGGTSFTVLDDSNGLPNNNIGRAELGFGSDGVAYASYSNNSDTTRGLWRSTDGGLNWTQTPSGTNYIPRQGWYDLMIGVDPTDSDTVFLGAVDVFRSTDAGANIGQISVWNPMAGQIPIKVHADIHAIAFDPNNTDNLWIGTDGGIYESNDGGDSFRSLGNNLRITQYYGIAVSPDGERVIGGTQDNGSHLFFGDRATWLEWAGGDGGFCAWDQQQDNFIYGSNPNGAVFGSANGGSNTAQMNLPDTTGALFIQPFTLDPNDGNRMIVGTDNIFFTSNARQIQAATWVDASGALGASVSSTTISLHDGMTAYAGTTAGAVFKSTNLGAGNTFAQLNNLVGNGTSTWIEVDPHDLTGNTLYATFGGYLPDRIHKSTDGGTNWTSISGDLPDVPLHCVSVDPLNPNRLFVGSEIGLFVTDNNGARGAFNWSQYDYGVAWTRVAQMFWGSDNHLWIGTHGRGIYKASRQPLGAELGELVDADCDGDNYIDDGEVVQVPVTITNNGGLPVSNVSVSLSSTYPGLAVNTGATAYGTIAPGTSQTQNFEVELSSLGACLDLADLQVDAVHDDGNLSETFSMTLGADPDFGVGTFVEDAETADHLMTTRADLDVDDWQRTTTQANDGVRSWFASNIDSYADKSLLSPWMEVQGNLVFDFSIFYDLEGDATQRWDGTVMEIRRQGETWTDIGQFSTVPYDGLLFDNNPLGIRNAWSGTQTTWRDAQVDLGAAYVGDRVQFRFRVGCDTGTANPGGGFWVDDISATNVTWLRDLICDTEACVLCFGTPGEALQAVLDSLGMGEWPVQTSVLDYVDDLNNVCP